MRHAGALVLVLTLVVLSVWPATGWQPHSLLGDPQQEAGEHLWALWAATLDGPLHIQTTRVGWPVGHSWVLADPLSLPAFTLGHGIFGMGLTAVHVQWLLVAALGAAAWARQLGTPPVWAAALAITLSPVNSPVVTGITDAAGFGLTLLALLQLHTIDEGPRGRGILGAGLLIGATAWAGPYPALYTLLMAPLVVWAPVQRHGVRAVGRLLGAGLLSLLVAAPVLWATTTLRDAALPGSINVLGDVLHDPAAPRALLLGLDPVGLVFPTAGLDWAHGGHLGLPLIAMALVGGIHQWRTRPPPWVRQTTLTVLTLAGVALVLSLGFHLKLNDAPATWSGHVIGLPARFLSEALPVLGRAPRWYRMATVAGLALAALAAGAAPSIAALLRRWGVPSPLSAGLSALVLILVSLAPLRSSPLPWPRPATLIEMPPLLDTLPLPGPLTLFPRAAGKHDGRAIRLIWQTQHGHPMVANPHAQRPPRNPAAEASQLLETAARHGDLDRARAALSRLQALGVVWVVVLPGPDTAALQATLTAVRGPPHTEDGESRAWTTEP